MHRNRGNLNSRLMRWRSSNFSTPRARAPVAPQCVVFINAVYNACVRILISAGEASGEMYGAQLIEALRRTLRFGQVGAAVLTQSVSNIEFFGVGGDKMRAAGCDIV